MAAMARTIVDTLRKLLEPPKSAAPAGSDPLREVVREHMREADDGTHRIVAAIAGLLAAVAYADHQYSPAEERKVREELGRVQGLGPVGVDAICAVLARDMARLAVVGDHGWVRDLKELADRDQRLEVLEVLMDLAAADDDFSLAEANYLRRLTTALGLEQEDYVTAQAHHRDKLSLLKS